MVRYEHMGFAVEATVIGLDRGGNLLVKGKVNGVPYSGTYREHPKRPGMMVVLFDRVLTVDGRQVGGVAVPEPVQATFEAARAEVQQAIEAYINATPPAYKIDLSLAEKMVIYPVLEAPRADGAKNKVTQELQRRIANLKGSRQLYLYHQLGAGKRDVSTEELIAALEAMEQEQEEQGGVQPQPTPKPQDPRPVVVLNRCYGCGKVTIERIPLNVDAGAVREWIRDMSVEPTAFRVQWETQYCGC